MLFFENSLKACLPTNGGGFRKTSHYFLKIVDNVHNLVDKFYNFIKRS